MLRFFQYHFNLKVGVVVVAAGVTKISSSFSYNTQVLELKRKMFFVVIVGSISS